MHIQKYIYSCAHYKARNFCKTDPPLSADSRLLVSLLSALHTHRSFLCVSDSLSRLFPLQNRHSGTLEPQPTPPLPTIPMAGQPFEAFRKNRKRKKTKNKKKHRRNRKGPSQGVRVPVDTENEDVMPPMPRFPIKKFALKLQLNSSLNSDVTDSENASGKQDTLD